MPHYLNYKRLENYLRRKAGLTMCAQFKIIAVFIVLGQIAFTMNSAAVTRKNDPILNSINYAALVINADTGKTLYEKHAKTRKYPASLTKMMTLYVTFDAIKSGKLKLTQSLKISAKAAQMPKSKLGVKQGDTITVKEAIYALIIKSANDVSVVLAEAVGGNEKKFVKMMNARAKQLGLKDTHFANPHGLHNPKQATTAWDMAKLAIALKKNHPSYYPMFARTSFIYKNRIVRSHNNVMYRYKGATGLKTGYINASGYNLVTSTHKPEGRLIGVVFGGQSAVIRDNHMINLLQAGYTKLAPKAPAGKQRHAVLKARYKTNAFAVLQVDRSAFKVLSKSR